MLGNRFQRYAAPPARSMFLFSQGDLLLATTWLLSLLLRKDKAGKWIISLRFVLYLGSSRRSAAIPASLLSGKNYSGKYFVWFGGLDTTRDFSENRAA